MSSVLLHYTFGVQSEIIVGIFRPGNAIADEKRMRSTKVYNNVAR